ncbi:MAG TPA: chromate transporter [Acetobacteraceae bacterium]|jgi:chromate transporter|nr:chromate transporter [Acetobacteraceae bacterium]
MIRISLAALFLAFLKVSLSSFGGGLVWARRVTVEQRRWLTEDEFTDILSLCQFLPGPNVIGIAVCVGAKFRGLAGAISAACGFLLIPLIIGFPLGVLYLQFTDISVFQNILRGVSAVASGLLIATGLRMLRPRRREPLSLIVAALAFCGMVFTKLPLIAVLSGVTLLSVVATKIETPRRS